MKVKVKKVNAFTDSKKGGNPAGVFINPPDLTDDQMAFITEKLQVSETAFVSSDDKYDYQVRFFSPIREVDLCGHATIAAFYTMSKLGLILSDRGLVNQNTKAGVLPVEVVFLDDDVKRVMMTQGEAIYKNISFNISRIAESLNIDKTEIDTSIPKQIVSTGLFTLPICVKSYKILKNMKPDFSMVDKICRKIGVGSFHVFTFETLEKESIYHARNFAPYYSINEDPVTGTANGAVCSFLAKNNIIKKEKMVCEQGDIIGRKGRVYVELKDDVVRVGGRANFVEEKEINI